MSKVETEVILLHFRSWAGDRGFDFGLVERRAIRKQFARCARYVGFPDNGLKRRAERPFGIQSCVVRYVFTNVRRDKSLIRKPQSLNRRCSNAIDLLMAPKNAVTV